MGECTGKMKIGINVAVSEFYKDDKYDLDFKNPQSDPNSWLTGEQLDLLYLSWIASYPIMSIEDPFGQNDWKQLEKLRQQTFQVVGDDLTVTNPKRNQMAVYECSVSDIINVWRLAKVSNLSLIVSQSSGETEETFIADLAVGLTVGQIKAGAPCRSERLAKYNQLLRIEEELGEEAVYAGEQAAIARIWRPFD